MKGSTHDNTGIYGLIAFIASLIKSLVNHIDGWGILQSVLCAVLAYFAVRLIKHLFPEKK